MLFLVVSTAILMKILTPVLAIDCFDLLGDYCHACGIDGGQDGISRVFATFGNGCPAGPIFL